MKTRVFNLIILDESGSMECIKRQALSGLNETLQTIRSAQEKYPEQEQLVTIVPFQTGSIKFLRDAESITNIQDLRPEEYNPGSCTPLYDAIGLSVSHLRQQISNVDSVLVTIITDGFENNSMEYNANTISRLIDEMKERGWLFTYIGANQDALAVARTINIHNAMNFVQDDAGTREMFRKEQKSRARFMDERVAFCRCFHSDNESIDAKAFEEAVETLNKEQAKRTDYFD